jgi:Flp pilus assembly protein TadG
MVNRWDKRPLNEAPYSGRFTDLRVTSKGAHQTMNHPARSKRQRRGVTAIEFALVAPLFFMLLLGIVEFGRVFMVMELLNGAARQACRQAMIEGANSTQIQQAAVVFLNGVGIDGTAATVNVNGVPVNTIDTTTLPAYADVTVQVTVPVSSVTWVPNGFIPSGNLAGQYGMRRE